jgi:hypothetical protein
MEINLGKIEIPYTGKFNTSDWGDINDTLKLEPICSCIEIPSKIRVEKQRDIIFKITEKSPFLTVNRKSIFVYDSKGELLKRIQLIYE